MTITLTTDSPAAAVARGPLRLLVVDDHPAVRAGLQRLLDREPDLRVEALAGGPAEALRAAADGSADVAVVDYHLGAQDGLALTRSLRAVAPSLRVLIYSAFADARLAIGAIVAGADGVINKAALGDELCQAIRSVAQGRSVLPAIPQSLFAALRAGLDPRRQAILGMLVHGLDDERIAEALSLSVAEVEAHRVAILRHLSAAPEERPLGADPGWRLDYERPLRARRR